MDIYSLGLYTHVARLKDNSMFATFATTELWTLEIFFLARSRCLLPLCISSWLNFDFNHFNLKGKKYTLVHFNKLN